jgi:hypothetical protein
VRISPSKPIKWGLIQHFQIVAESILNGHGESCSFQKHFIASSSRGRRFLETVGTENVFHVGCEREVDCYGGAEPRTGAGGSGVTSVLTGDVANEKEAEASSLELRHGAAGDTVEAFEDALELGRFEADAGIGDGEGDGGVVDDGQRAADMDAFGGVFDGVIEDVDDGGADVFGDAKRVETDGAWSGFEDDAASGKVVTLEGDGDAVGEEGFEVDEGAVLLALALAQLPGFEDLLDGGEEAVRV